MRLSRPKILILLAIWIIVLIELRTVLGLFGLDLNIESIVVIGVVSIGAFVFWLLNPRATS